MNEDHGLRIVYVYGIKKWERKVLITSAFLDQT